MHRLALLLVMVLANSGHAEAPWVDLFNGRDLEGWIPKIRGYPAGDNFANTFRVEDGLLKVRFDGYERYDDRFGHLFWREPYSHYHLLIEYRFVGRQVHDGPDWAARNGGVMLHSQRPDTMRLTQEFPISIEAQLLGGLRDGRPRPTANVCTPGTHIVYRERVYTSHCLNSTSPTFDGDQWVRVEIVVRGAEHITHIVNGEVVLEYASPMKGPSDEHPEGEPALIESGYIALQSESHPMDYRMVRIRNLAGATNGSRR